MTRQQANPEQPRLAGAAEWEQRAWTAFITAGQPVTAVELAEAASVTKGAAVRWLAEWTRAGHATRGTPPPGAFGAYTYPYTPTTKQDPPQPAAGPTPNTTHPRRVLVTGSRTWTAEASIADALRPHYTPGAVLITGACPSGADAIAEHLWTSWGGRVEPHPADWSAGRAAGPTRNTAMVAAGADVCLAFIRDHSPGATHTARLAEAAGIPTHRYPHPATTTTTTRPDTGKEAPPRPAAGLTPTARPRRATPPTGAGARVGELLAVALDHAARGWHVIPLRPGAKTPAFPDHNARSCRGTDPRCRTGHTGWEQRATTDPDRIRRAWRTTAWNVGIACGPSGLLVVDLDTPKPGDGPRPAEWMRPGVGDGADVWRILRADAGHPGADTYTVRTGRGGAHHYYQQPPGQPLGNSTGALGWKVDTRGVGGLVVAAGSIVDSRPYTRTHDTTPAPAPEWLVRRLQPAPLPPPRPVPVLPADRTARWVAAALTGEATRVATAVAGTHNHALYAAARILGELVAGGAVAEDTVRTTLADAALTLARRQSCGCTPTDIDRTITSGLRAGAKRPRSAA